MGRTYFQREDIIRIAIFATPHKLQARFDEHNEVIIFHSYFNYHNIYF